ncbi:hypothetical protein P171DRAFT_39741 [Karstenula rhodostoma CBS 690.94]|uniref:Uncharacterized protein n=1 Tax=Karstenula rhodostoma CBS 690.94 TaxID=1392251 RepID=A0A9P4PGK5_9PLEO|nr:hypothetical protein P171DRAFT_39741 [Karstenula rhodostoma CBS 690.94]
MLVCHRVSLHSVSFGLSIHLLSSAPSRLSMLEERQQSKGHLHLHEALAPILAIASQSDQHISAYALVVFHERIAEGFPEWCRSLWGSERVRDTWCSQRVSQLRKSRLHRRSNCEMRRPKGRLLITFSLE